MNIITNIGENFEYVRTIAQNEIELKKLELIESTSNLVSYLLLALVVGSLVSVLLVMFLIGITVWCAQILHSYPMAIAVVSVFLLIVITVLMLFRNHLIVGPIKNKLYKSILKND